ncbi:MAG: hypothetical protein K5945_08165 [Bacteroidaceae bacterium]|nr:hypothetical protein [Bacteroidaceae bacterium]
MKTLSPIENFLFRIGAIGMLVGLVVRMFDARLSLYIYAVGALCFCLMQVRAEYLGNDLVVRRLRRQQLLACVFFILTAVCMSMQTLRYGFCRRNEWMVALAIACLLELYTAWRIPAELQKVKKS